MGLSQGDLFQEDFYVRSYLNHRASKCLATDSSRGILCSGRKKGCLYKISDIRY